MRKIVKNMEGSKRVHRVAGSLREAKIEPKHPTANPWKLTESERRKALSLTGMSAIWICSQCEKPIPINQMEIPVTFAPRNSRAAGFLGREVTKVICQTCDNTNKGVPDKPLYCLPVIDCTFEEMMLRANKGCRRKAGQSS